MAENFPPDLVDLQRAFEDADRAVHAYVATTDAAGAPWSVEQQAELTRLRGERMVALKALWAHPKHAGIQAAGQWSALKKAARED